MPQFETGRRQRPPEQKEPWRRSGEGDDPGPGGKKEGPTRPQVPERIRRRMQGTDRDQAKRYRQRTGQ